MIGADTFQEMSIVEVTRSITKHNYLVLDVDEIPRIVRETHFLASSGRPGSILIDIPSMRMLAPFHGSSDTYLETNFRETAAIGPFFVGGVGIWGFGYAIAFMMRLNGRDRLGLRVKVGTMNVEYGFGK
ncbi:hypothetical protein Sjap_011461 [Stephania japonica]|uniref:Uncharacterized protein n=1 Tax=Stephania japonica TaxID=461633 RepID=A0AAP0P5K3_9MAGN